MKRLALPTAALALGGAILIAPALSASGDVELVTISSAGVKGNGNSFGLDISGDGRYVTYETDATNLHPSDPDGNPDVFVRDTTAGITELTSVSSAGTKGNGNSTEPAISSDGVFVAFRSSSSNLHPSDPDTGTDIFVRNRSAGTTDLVSLGTSGVKGNDDSRDPSISSDGRFVAFSSDSTNLAAADTDGTPDIYVRDRIAGTTTLVSVSSAGTKSNGTSQTPAISDDGRFVAFRSIATNLAAGDTDSTPDIFLHDRTTGTTELVSISSSSVKGNGNSARPRVSSDGQQVTFESLSTNLHSGDTDADSDIFVRDRATGTTDLVSVNSSGVKGDDESLDPDISGDGRFVVYWSRATNLSPDDTNHNPGDTNLSKDIFMFDRTKRMSTLVSIYKGNLGTGFMDLPAISTAGRFVAFNTDRANFHPSKTDAVYDNFVKDVMGATPVVSVPQAMTVATAPGATSAVVTYTVTATDTEDGAITPTCTPPSGSTFPVGTTTVTCTAMDSNWLVGTSTFTVTVIATPVASTPVKRTFAPRLTCSATVRAGKVAGYRLVVRNPGRWGVKGVRVSAALPNKVSIPRFKKRKASNRNYRLSGGLVSWKLGKIRPGKRKVVMLRGKVARNAHGRMATRVRIRSANAGTVTRACVTRAKAVRVTIQPRVTG